MAGKLFARFFLFFAILMAVPFLGHAQLEKMGTCLVMPRNAVKEKFFVDYHGKRFYFCCKACVKAFKKNPEKYLKRIPKES